MYSLIDYSDAAARMVLQGLLNSFWQGLVVGALAWVILRSIKGVSAATRHAVWMITLLTIGVLPFTATMVEREVAPVKLSETTRRRSPVAIQRIGPVLSAELTVSPNEPAGIVATRFDGATGSAPDRLSPIERSDSKERPIAQVEEATRYITRDEASKAVPATASTIAPATVEETFSERVQARLGELLAGQTPLVLAGLWLIGMGLMLARIARSYWSLVGLRRRLSPAATAECARVDRLAERFRIKRRVRLLTSDQISMPMTIGTFRPVIIIPPDLTGNLSTTEFESVIAHELAHIKRWDYSTNFLQRLAQAVFYFHPAVWLINRQLVIERELACDDWAVKTCEPRRYAGCLTKLLEMLGESKPVAAAAGILFGKQVISRRVEMILNRNRNASTAVSKPALVYTVGAAVLVVCLISLIAPVIAVPLAQDRDGKAQAKKEKKSPEGSQAQSKVPPAPPAPPAPPSPEAPPAPPAPPAEPDSLDAPELATVPLLDDDEIIGAAPVAAWGTGVSFGQGGVVATAPVAPVAPVAGFGWGSGQGFGQGSGVATTAPRAATMTGWGQDEKNRTPAIPEAELLTVLTDIVKRDADPAVRNEALQGIYRMRSDAAINTLIQLYDGISDVKVKGEIVGFLIRSNGDNSKAIAKLLTIAKSEQNEELRSRAIRTLARVKGDEGANNLIQIYDSLQDSRLKQRVISSLANNKSRKAIDKLIQIAKNDADPTIRQAAIRSLYAIDNRLYLQFADGINPKISLNGDVMRKIELDSMRGNLDRFRLEDFDLNWSADQKRLFEENRLKLKEELPKIKMKLKDLEQNFQFDLAPEIQEKLDELAIPRPRVERRATPTPKPNK